MRYKAGYTRETRIHLKDAPEAVRHFQLYGWVRVRHVFNIILIIHGTESGEIPDLPRVRQLGLRFDQVVACFPVACRQKNPDLHIIGEFNAESALNYDSTSLRVYFA